MPETRGAPYGEGHYTTPPSLADCTNLYGYGYWHKLRRLPRQRLRRLLGLHTTECVHCHRRFKHPAMTEDELAREATRRRQEAEGRREGRRGLPRLPPR